MCLLRIPQHAAGPLLDLAAPHVPILPFIAPSPLPNSRTTGLAAHPAGPVVALAGCTGACGGHSMPRPHLGASSLSAPEAIPAHLAWARVTWPPPLPQCVFPSNLPDPVVQPLQSPMHMSSVSALTPCRCLPHARFWGWGNRHSIAVGWVPGPEGSCGSRDTATALWIGPNGAMGPGAKLPAALTHPTVIQWTVVCHGGGGG